MPSLSIFVSVGDSINIYPVNIDLLSKTKIENLTIKIFFDPLPNLIGCCSSSRK